MTSGAQIERGLIVNISSDRYNVKSYTRPGIITPPIKSGVTGLSMGDQVYFFVFSDGDGLIIGKL